MHIAYLQIAKKPINFPESKYSWKNPETSIDMNWLILTYAVSALETI
jgi:hypothetical protein